MAPSAGVEPTIFPLGGDCIIHYATGAIGAALYRGCR